MKSHILKLAIVPILAFLFVNHCGKITPVSIEPAMIRVISPAAGDSWIAGSTYSLRWDLSDGSGDSVMITLSNDTGVVVTIAAVAANNGIYPWTIPLKVSSFTCYRITISSITADSVAGSSGCFSIINNADEYEPDDSASLAAPIDTSGTLQYHTLPGNDRDWCSFYATAGRTYCIQTYGNTDTYLELYATNGSTLLSIDENQGEGLNAMIIWVCTSSGTYYFRTTGRTTGPSQPYSVNVRAGSAILELVYPDSGRSFVGGDQVAIEWKHSINSGTSVSLYLYGDDTLVSTIASGTANNGSYSWTIPHAVPTSPGYRIKIVSNDDTSICDFSRFFMVTNVPTSFTITTPSSATQWNTGAAVSINWTCSGNPGPSARLSLYIGDSLAMTITGTTGAATGYYLWNVPWTLTTSSACRVKITSLSDTAVYDFSEQFTITKIPSTLTITSPTSTTNWNTGTSNYISWTYSGNPGSYASLALFNGDSLVMDITLGTPTGNGRYYWTIPWAPVTSSAYRVKITSTSDSSVYDYSEYFTITRIPAINVTTPSTGTTWNAGSSHYLYWNSVGSVPGSYVAIFLCDSAQEITIDPGVSRSNGSYNWKLPATLRGGSSYRIKVMSTADTGAYGYSGYFTVVPLPNRLTITLPAAGSAWIAGDYYTVYWSYSGSDLPGSYVKLDLYDSTWFVQTILPSTDAANGSYFWQLPSSLPSSTRYQVKIASTTLDTVFDFSDFFTITNPSLVGDSYEPDDTYDQAKVIAKNDPPQSHTLSSGDDEDWLKFDAAAGTTYTIETQGTTDTYLDLFGTDGATIIASNDDISGLNTNARIVWTCTSNGTYYFKVTGWDVGSYTVTLR